MFSAILGTGFFLHSRYRRSELGFVKMFPHNPESGNHTLSKHTLAHTQIAAELGFYGFFNCAQLLCDFSFLCNMQSRVEVLITFKIRAFQRNKECSFIICIFPKFVQIYK